MLVRGNPWKSYMSPQEIEEQTGISRTSVKRMVGQKEKIQTIQMLKTPIFLFILTSDFADFVQAIFEQRNSNTCISLNPSCLGFKFSGMNTIRLNKTC